MTEANEARRRLSFTEDVPKTYGELSPEECRELTHETMNSMIDELDEIAGMSESDEVSHRLTQLLWLARDVADATE